MSIALTVQQLSVILEQANGGELHVLGPLSMTIPAGQFVCLVGPSGCGKSTLIRVFAGLQKPASGQAFIGGQVVDGPSPRVGMMFQQANLMPWRTVLENVVLPLELAGAAREGREARAMDLLRMLKLDGFAESYPGALSGGMAQRTALGRLLAQEPDALLLDEPFGALDAMTRERVGADLLRVWNQSYQTVLMVTHDINEAIYLADRVVVMSRRPGRIAGDFMISLPRPRQLEMLYEPEFGALAKQIRALIQED
jgi:NitT/TauT family transport system ATP-binding protein